MIRSILFKESLWAAEIKTFVYLCAAWRVRRQVLSRSRAVLVTPSVIGAFILLVGFQHGLLDARPDILQAAEVSESPNGFVSAITLIGVQKLTPSEGFIAPRWSPVNLDQVAFTKEGYKGLYLLTVSQGRFEPITEDAGAGFKFMWTADGKSIAFRSRLEGGVHRIRIADVQTKHISDISNNEEVNGLPQESSPGVLSYRLKHETRNVRLRDSDQNRKDAQFVYQQSDQIFLEVNGRSIQISEGEGKYYLPSLSPDRAKVVYEEISRGIYVYDTNKHRSVHIGRGNSPSWSPDSRFIVYDLTIDDGHKVISSDLWLSDYSGGLKRKLLSDLGEVALPRRPCFLPDSKHISFDSQGAIYIGELRF